MGGFIARNEVLIYIRRKRLHNSSPSENVTPVRTEKNAALGKNFGCRSRKGKL